SGTTPNSREPPSSSATSATAAATTNSPTLKQRWGRNRHHDHRERSRVFSVERLDRQPPTNCLPVSLALGRLSSAAIVLGADRGGRGDLYSPAARSRGLSTIGGGRPRQPATYRCGPGHWLSWIHRSAANVLWTHGPDRRL